MIRVFIHGRPQRTADGLRGFFSWEATDGLEPVDEGLLVGEAEEGVGRMHVEVAGVVYLGQSWWWTSANDVLVLSDCPEFVAYFNDCAPSRWVDRAINWGLEFLRQRGLIRRFAVAKLISEGDNLSVRSRVDEAVCDPAG